MSWDDAHDHAQGSKLPKLMLETTVEGVPFVVKNREDLLLLDTVDVVPVSFQSAERCSRG